MPGLPGRFSAHDPDLLYQRFGCQIFRCPNLLSNHSIHQLSDGRFWLHNLAAPVSEKYDSSVRESALDVHGGAADSFLVSPVSLYRPMLRQIPQNFTRRMWVILDIVCLSSFVGILTTIYHGDMFTSYQTYPACIACIITSLGICRLGALLSKNLRAQMEIQTLRYQQVYYEELENNQEQIRKLRHDMKNHLTS